MTGIVRVYLAGPEVFLKNAVEIGDQKKKLCAKYGFQGVFPIDGEIDIEKKSKKEIGLCISATNEQLIKSCQLVIANITPFRGPSADVGTVYEMGYGHGNGLKIFAYSNVPEIFSVRTTKFFDNISKDDSGVFRDNNHMAVEDWGLVDNLMIDGCIYYSGGRLVIEQAPKDKLYTHLAGFEKCLQHARMVFSQNPKNRDSNASEF